MYSNYLPQSCGPALQAFGILAALTLTQTSATANEQPSAERTRATQFSNPQAELLLKAMSPVYYTSSSNANNHDSDLSREFEIARTMTSDWDGYGAAKPNEISIGLLEKLMNRFSYSTVSPRLKYGSDGEVGLYWRSSSDYLEVTVEPSGALIVYRADSDLEPLFYSELHEFDDLVPLLKTIRSKS